MLKSETTLIIVQSRLKLTPLVRRRVGNFAIMTTANSSNDESVSTRAQQQMLHSQRAKEQQKHEEQKKREDSQRKERGAPAYFPLGYKEAAYQWVR